MNLRESPIIVIEHGVGFSSPRSGFAALRKIKKGTRPFNRAQVCVGHCTPLGRNYSSNDPNVLSWHDWHMPLIVYSLRERSSVKSNAAFLHHVQVLARMALGRDTPVRVERCASIAGCFLVGTAIISISINLFN